jgi:hypothetical protein
VGTLVFVMLFRAENTGETGQDFVRFFIPGMAFAVLLIAGIDALRAWAQSSLGFSLPE